MTDLARIEAVLDEAGLAAQLAALEARLPVGVRPRQCSARTLLVGMLACLSHSHQNAHLTAVHAALLGLDEKDQIRLGVLASWRNGRHALTYRQIEYTAGLIFRGVGTV